MLRIKKNDIVAIIAGKDKGRRGKVLKMLSDEMVLVDGINKVKKHQKPNPKLGPQDGQGGIVDKTMPIHISNIALYNLVTKKADRVGFKNLEDGKKVRYFKSNNEVIDVQG